MLIRQIYVNKNKNFYRLVFKLLALKGQNRVSLTSFNVAMATLTDVKVTLICFLLKPLNICTKSYSSPFLVWQLLNAKDGNVQPLRATLAGN